jgi:uncharacterized protein (DUF3820 family)
MSYTTMPFGKYKGVSIKDLPTNYVCYAITEFDLPEELKSVLFQQLMENIGGWDFINDTEIDSKKIDHAYKKAAIKYHPDKGGSTEAMQAINEFKRLIYE